MAPTRRTSGSRRRSVRHRRPAALGSARGTPVLPWEIPMSGSPASGGCVASRAWVSSAPYKSCPAYDRLKLLLQSHGEEVLFLEIMLGYQHRGVERLLETASADRAVLVAEAIA